jgi:hypothetical protein
MIAGRVNGVIPLGPLALSEPSKISRRPAGDDSNVTFTVCGARMMLSRSVIPCESLAERITSR